MVYLLLGFILLFMFVLSFLGGYILGKGKITLPRKLTEEEKRLMQKQDKEFEQMRSQFNDVVNELLGVRTDV